MPPLEKAINLLQTMPEHKLEAIYMYMQFVNSFTENEETFSGIILQKDFPA